MEAEDQVAESADTQSLSNTSYGVLGSIGGAINFSADDIARQKAAERERNEWMERERLERLGQRDDQVRQAAMHAALLLDYPSKDAHAVLTAARQIESFLRGEASQAGAH